MCTRVWRAVMVMCTVLVATSAWAVPFYPISGITTSTVGDLWPVSNLIQGPGVGFDANPPHDKTLSGPAGNWVTAAPGGFPSDYIAVAGTPVLTLDLGADTLLGEISTWGYAVTNGNGVSEFSLLFATSADGLGGFGTSITYNPTFNMSIDDTSRQSFPFSQYVRARYVQFTAEDNFYGVVIGGDRVGLGEIAFENIPEPTTLALSAVGLLTLVRRRRRTT